MKKEHVGSQPVHTGNQAAAEFVPDLLLCGINTPTCATYLITKKEFTLGKAEDCDGILAFSEEISKQHARITWHDGCYYIVDLNSTNKTFVNGKMLEPNKEEPLHTGDIVSMSANSFLIEKINR